MNATKFKFLGPNRDGILFFWLILTVNTALFSKENAEAWAFLIDNKPFEAEQIFKENIADPNGKKAGEAYRGLAAVNRFLGRSFQAMQMTFKSFLADRDTVLFDASWINSITFSRSWDGHTVRDGYEALEALTSVPSLMNGGHFSSLVERLVNDGKLKEARTLTGGMGIVRRFRMAGPFENVSGSGYKKEYPPEKEVDFDAVYEGKNGARIVWFPFYNSDPNGWVFTEYNYSSQNAALFYYTNVKSTVSGEFYLGFGASGTFKVFLNDNMVLADSVFRNTGTDVFIQKIRLFKGDNKLLIKIGHESRFSNFLVRFMDGSGKAPSCVSYTDEAGSFRKDSVPPENLLNSPLIERVENNLTKILSSNGYDIEAGLLLMDFYNTTEFTDEGQKLAKSFLQEYPASSIWHSLYSESLQRSRKITEAATQLKSAYKLCQYNSNAWDNELALLSSTASSRDVVDFIDNSPELFRNTPQALIAKFAHYMKNGNESEGLKVLERLEQEHSSNSLVIKLLATFYTNQGNIKKAEKLLRKLVKWQRSSEEGYSMLANLYMKMGQRKKAIKTYNESLKYAPNSTGYYYYLATLSFQLKDYKTAEENIEKALKIMPSSEQLLNLKGTILAAQNRTEEAVSVLENSIDYHYDNFSAWEQILKLKGKKELMYIAPPPDPDSLLGLVDTAKTPGGEKGVIVAFYKDVFMYPSRCSRERNFLMVHLPTRNAIDIWKEYSIPYNGYYQLLNISRAYSKSSDGRESPADVNQNMAVFKTLQPGDCIVLEWTLENYYSGDMARQVWGEFSFDLSYPVYRSRLRLVTPENDTIPYRQQGDSITADVRRDDGFRVTSFSRDRYKNPTGESFMLIDPPSSRRVYYSTVESWGDIVEWYLNLTENKLEQTTELKAIADSLFTYVTTPQDRVVKIHEYITNNVRYSFVPFRQSAWTPQPAREVLATKIGDCKDMASLGKSLFDYAGIKSNLVLVNTRDVNGIYPAYIGPNFNHCILSYILDDNRYFCDFTDNSISVDRLPKMDQGALALIVNEGNNELTHLPLDSSEDRSTKRKIRSILDDKGVLSRSVSTVKTGVFAGQMRSSYRFLSEEERERYLQKILVEDYPDLKIDSLAFVYLDTLSDTIIYEYGYTVKNAVNFSGNTAIFALQLPDLITGDRFPSEEPRNYDIDMAQTWFDIGTFYIEGELKIPKGWRLINTPKPSVYSAKYGKYEMKINQKKDAIRYSRKAVFDFREPISAVESGELRIFLSKIAKADNVQLMFYTE